MISIKPLEWREEDEDGWWSALPMTGLPYEVRRTDRGNVRVRVPDNGEWCPFDGTVAEAKAAAQADFERHILSALSQSHPADEQAVEARNYEAFRTFAHEATKAITNLTGGGSEYFGKEVDGVFLADLPRCVERLRHRIDVAARPAKEGR